MATALEKIDKIENIRDDGTSTKLSDQAASTKDSESTMDNGKKSMEFVYREKKKNPSMFSRKCKYE